MRLKRGWMKGTLTSTGVVIFTMIAQLMFNKTALVECVCCVITVMVT